jgi:hypothetical protein
MATKPRKTKPSADTVEAAPIAASRQLLVSRQLQQAVYSLGRRLSDIDDRAAAAADTLAALAASVQAQSATQKTPSVKDDFAASITSLQTQQKSVRAQKASNAADFAELLALVQPGAPK